MGFNKTNERVNVLGSYVDLRLWWLQEVMNWTSDIVKTTSGTSEQKYRSKWGWCIVGSEGRDSKVLNLINTEPDLSVLSIMC